MNKEGPVLAIVGSRTFDNETLLNETIERFVLEYGMPSRVVSGGAKGADQMGEAWAHRRGIPVTSFRPKWKRPDGTVDMGAGIKRNSDIVRECTHMIAFPSKKGRGTQDSMRKAREVGKLVMVKYWK